jgi:hypothetical protein
MIALRAMAPRDPVKRLAYLNGAIAVLDLLAHDRRTMAQEQTYRAARREAEQARQELLDAREGT